MGYPSEKIGVYRFRPVQICPRRQPEYFLPIIGLIGSVVGSMFKANDKDIAKKISGMSEEASNRLYSNEAVTNELLDEMTPFKSSNTFYIIIGVALLLFIIIGIVLYKRK